MKSALIFT